MRGIYVNREYSWLLFNKRVLDQASDLTNPLLERCKFLSIFASNLDEFFMVRVGSLCNESLTDPNVKENKTGLTPAKQLEGIRAVVRRHYQNRISAYIKLRGELNKAGVRILKASELTPRQSEECKSYFLAHVLPLLSMMVLDAKHPMMQFENRRHYMIYDLEREGRRMIGVTFLNPAADRLYRIGYGKKVKLVPVEELLKAFGHLGFMGYTVRGRMLMRVTRNADVDTRVDDNDVEHDFFRIHEEEDRVARADGGGAPGSGRRELAAQGLRAAPAQARPPITASRIPTSSITSSSSRWAIISRRRRRRSCATRPSRARSTPRSPRRLRSSTISTARTSSCPIRTTA